MPSKLSGEPSALVGDNLAVRGSNRRRRSQEGVGSLEDGERRRGLFEDPMQGCVGEDRVELAFVGRYMLKILGSAHQS